MLVNYFSSSSSNKTSHVAYIVSYIQAAIDLGASNHCFPNSYREEAYDSSKNGVRVGTANDSVMKLTVTNRIIIPDILAPARECNKFAKVSLPLMSVGKFCQYGMRVIFDETSVVKNMQGQIVLQGKRDPFRNLYTIPVAQSTDVPPKVETHLAPTRLFPDPPSLIRQRAASAYKVRTVPALISYLHAAAGFLPKDTFIAGVNEGFYTTWSGLNDPQVRKHFKNPNTPSADI